MKSYVEEIRSSKLTAYEEAKKIYLNHRPVALYDSQHVYYEIRASIAAKFSVPLSCIFVCGSAQVGYSPYKEAKFTPTGSDLDIAIVHAGLYSRYLRLSYDQSDGLRDRTKFPRKKEIKGNQEKEIDPFELFCLNLALGFFRPDYMPNGKVKGEWFDFFATLSKKYKDFFYGINAGIYLSEEIFLHKQMDAVVKIKNVRKGI